MRALHGTVLAVAMAALLAHGAVDPLAGSPEGERVMLWPEGKTPSAEAHQYESPFIEWFAPSNKPTGAAKTPLVAWRGLLWDWLVQLGFCDCRETMSGT